MKRVAVIGAGAAGSACAWRLLTGKPPPGLCVSVFEMGRGAGGRAGTRRVPELPGLRVNHGAPLFHVPAADAHTNELISALVAGGHLEEWRGSSGHVDAATGAVTAAATASRGEPSGEPGVVTRYVGRGGMSALARGCLELARDGGPPAGASLETHFATRVKHIAPQKVGEAIQGWEISDKDGNNFGVFDWVVISGATPALARWRDGFKEEPPVYEAAQQAGSGRLRDLIARLDRPLAYEQAHVALLAWDLSAAAGGAGEGGGAAARVAEALARVPPILHVENDADLAKVAVQSAGPPYAVVALHSTHAFAQTHKKVMGSGSFVSVSNNVEGSVSGEAAAGRALLQAFEAVLQRMGAAAGPLPPPAFGPAIHRWGAAFPEPEKVHGADAELAWVLPPERVAFAGDYLSPPHGCVATALRSGIAAADEMIDAVERSGTA